ncbi:MAG: hypothetical protein WC455_14265 [Dehalococcoidia bacterium]|jgi:hypothetical protein
MNPSIDNMLNEVFAASLGGERDRLVELAGREQIASDLDVVIFYLAKLSIDGSPLAGEVLRQMRELEAVAV